MYNDLKNSKLFETSDENSVKLGETALSILIDNYSFNLEKYQKFVSTLKERVFSLEEKLFNSTPQKFNGEKEMPLPASFTLEYFNSEFDKINTEFNILLEKLNNLV